MNYPFSQDNMLCKYFGHRFSAPYRDRKYVPYDSNGSVRWEGEYKGPERRTCCLCGYTYPPRAVSHDR